MSRNALLLSGIYKRFAYCLLRLGIAGLACFALGSSGASAQRWDAPQGLNYHTIRFQHLSTDDGLSQDDVTPILEDRSGNIWTRTGNGGSWRAYLLYGLLVVCLLYGLRKYEVNRLRLKSRLEMERMNAERLRELDRAKSRIFANVSHEFRTPLTLTLGPLDDLQSGLYGSLPDPVSEQIEMARRNARRVLDLINQILDVARLESGRTPLRARRIDLVVFVRGVCQVHAPAARRKALRLDLQLPDESLPIFADPEHLEKTLSNLLSNALKFTPEGGTVRVTVEEDADTVRIIVRDSGQGFRLRNSSISSIDFIA